MAHTYWRLNITLNAGDVNFLSISEIEMRGTVGGADQCAGGTASASTESVGFEAASAFDNDAATRWSTTTLTGWIKYQFASPVDVQQYTIQAHPTTPLRSPRSWTLEWSDDDSAWTSADTRTGHTGWTNGEIKSFTVGISGSSQLEAYTLSALDYADGNGSIELSAYTADAGGVMEWTQTIDGSVSLSPYTLSGETLQIGATYGRVNLGDPTGGPDGMGQTPWTLDAQMSSTIVYVGAVDLGDLENILILSETPWALNAVAFANGIGDGFSRARTYALDAEAVTGVVGVGDAELEAFTGGGSLEPALALPLYTLSADGQAGVLLNGDAEVLPFTADATAVSGSAADGDVTLPEFTAAGDVGTAGDAVFEIYSLVATGVNGTAATGSAILRAFTAAGVMAQNNSAVGEISLPLYASTGDVGSGSASYGAVVLHALTLSATGTSGAVATGEITVPLLQVDAAGYSSTIGTANVVLPVFSLAGVMAGTVAAPVFTSITLNTRTGAVTTYDSMAFNSMCSFNGVVLAASSAGIVALLGDTDNGDPINASMRVGTTDFGNSAQKRVLAGYVGYRADGELQITIINDEHHENIYRLEPRRQDELHPARVKFGRGVKGGYIQWQLSNVNGADFELDSLTLDADILSRRV